MFRFVKGKSVVLTWVVLPFNKYKNLFSFLESFAEVGAAQANFQSITKERDHCAALKKDCTSAKCCKITGYRCIKGSEKEAKCAKTCPKKGPCTVMSETMTFDTHDRTSLFCFSVWTTIKVEDVEGDFHFAKRKNMGTWINTGMYKQVWKALGQRGNLCRV